MSTKTSIKRIALVAAAALTLGGFSAVSANATVLSGSTAIICPVSLEANALGALSCTGQVGGSVTLTWTNTGGTTDSSKYKFTVSGMSITSASATVAPVAVSSVSATDWSLGFTTAPTATSDTVTVTLTAAAAGTGTLSVSSISATSGALTATDSAVVTWVATSSIGASAQYSSVFAIAGDNDATAVPAKAIPAPATAAATSAHGSSVATIKVVVRDSYGNPISGANVNATITGPGTLGGNQAVSTASISGRSLTGTATSGGVYYFNVFADGTAGASTIAITSGALSPVALGTIAVTFYGKPVVAKATQNLNVAKAGQMLGSAASAYHYAGNTVGNGGLAATLDALDPLQVGTAAFTVAVTDANGNYSTGVSTYKLVSSNANVITVGTCVEEASGASATTGLWQCSVSGATGATSGQSATVTFKIQNGTTDTAGVYSVVAAPLTFKIGGSIKTTTLSLDSASYTAGAPMSIVATLADSAGNAAYDQDANLFDAALKSTQALGTATALPSGAGATVIDGKSTFKGFYTPILGGDFTITGSTGTLTTTATVAALSVTGSAEAPSSLGGGLALDAANAATDAANNAYDEAQNATQAASDALAAVTALSAQVGALIATVKSLAAVVAKIKAKVKA